MSDVELKYKHVIEKLIPLLRKKFSSSKESSKLIESLQQYDGGDCYAFTVRFEFDLGADSLDVVELIIDIEEQFCISFGDDVAQELKTVKDLLDCMINKI